MAAAPAMRCCSVSQPSFVAGVVQPTTFDGSYGDLLTAGLGKPGCKVRYLRPSTMR